MIRYKGNKMVEVFRKASAKVLGGMMVSSGGYLGTLHNTDIFYFVEETRFVGGRIVMQEYRVSNVRKPGIYRKGSLLGY